jgi:hypothetical protein
MSAGRIRRSLFLLAALTTACGGGGPSSPSAAQTPIPVPTATPGNGFMYLRGIGGYWGFRIGANGLLTPVAPAPLAFFPPVFSRDGTKVAMWTGSSVVVRAVSGDGTFGATLAQAALLLPRPTSTYEVQWNPAGTQIFVIGGDGGDYFSGFFGGQILGFSFTGSALTPMNGGAQPTGVTPTSPVFPTSDVMVVRSGGVLGGVLAPADVRVYSTGGGELRGGDVIVDEGYAGGTRNLDPFISRDGRYVVAGDASYSIRGVAAQVAAKVPRTGALRLASDDEIEGLAPLRDSFVLAKAYRLRGKTPEVFGFFRLEDDGSFSSIGAVEYASVSTFLWGVLRDGRVLWITDALTGEVLTLTVSDAGQPGPLKLQTFSVAASVTSYLCGADVTGHYLYCFGDGVAAAAAVAEDGTLTAFSPFASSSPFPAIRDFLIPKP